MMRFSLSLSLFCLMGYLSKVHERLLHKPPVFIICLALSARILTQYVGCFLSGNSLGTLVHRPGSFLLNRKFLCFFPSFLGSLHFKWPFLTQGFIKEGSLSWAQLVFTNLEHSLPHSRWAFPRHIVLISFCSSDTMDFGNVKLVRY